MRYPSDQRGFSLVELLVVIAIIAILSAISMASFGIVQQRSRDTRRMQDLQAISKALALYDVQNGAFPIATTPTNLTNADAVSIALVNSGAIVAVPRDPAAPTYEYVYQTNSIGNIYTITFCLVTDTIQGYAQGCTNVISP